MNTYEIAFTRENGTTGSDRFTAPNEAQARRDFKEVYRHSEGTITSVELIRSDVPATKQQERDALKKLRKIVAELGSDSYIATALAGCFEIAESNIENDFADSMAERYESAKQDAAHFHEAVNTFSNDLDRAMEEIATLKSELASTREIANHNARQCDEARSEIGEYQRRTEEAEAEVVRLKAKLYDYIVAGA